MKAGDRPQDAGELLSRLDERLRRLEQAKTLTVGPWRLLVDDGGALVAVHAQSGAVRPVALPEEA